MPELRMFKAVAASGCSIRLEGNTYVVKPLPGNESMKWTVTYLALPQEGTPNEA